MERGSSKRNTHQDQHSLRVSKKAFLDSYKTHREDITEVAIDSIQPCFIIPDYKDPTSSTLPIVVQSPVASVCIDGWHFIEQAKAAGKSSIRCYIYYTVQHSDIEIAIRKTVIRIIPQGGKCSYAELVRNTCRLNQVLQGISDELILFSHGGDRRSGIFTKSKKNNIKIVLENRLGKNPKTINKYFQHCSFLSDATLEFLIDEGASKLFFEAFQVQKQILIAALVSEGAKHEIILETVSKHVLEWFVEFQQFNSSINNESENSQTTQTGQPIITNGPVSRTDQIPLPRQRLSQQNPEINSPAVNEYSHINAVDAATELKRIGEILIGISSDQENPILQYVEILKDLIEDLAALLIQIPHLGDREKGGIK